MSGGTAFSPAAHASDKKAESPQEETTEPYDSKTRGAIQIKGDTKDWFEILQDGKPKHHGAPPLLNKTVEVLPGSYEVVVNKSKRTVKVEVGKKSVLLTGTLVVEGKKANFYMPFQGRERKVTGNPRTLNTPMALFAGTYRVELNVGVNRQVVLTESERIEAGKKTVLSE
jgi:hypothetical protein